LELGAWAREDIRKDAFQSDKGIGAFAGVLDALKGGPAGDAPVPAKLEDLLVRKITTDQEPLEALKRDAEKFLAAVRDFSKENADYPPWLGLEGHILSGVDWSLLRSDGVIEFDGQLTITDGLLNDKKGEGVLVNARTSGAVDLVANDAERPYSIEHAMDLWLRAAGDVPVALNIKFEAPQESEPWASKKYTRRKGQLKYVMLSRGQFVGCGTIKSLQKQGTTIELEVFQVVAPGKVVRPGEDDAKRAAADNLNKLATGKLVGSLL